MRRNNGWISVHDEEKPETGAQKYHYLVTIAESPIGIVCWKHLDWPAPQN
ncbi:MAG: hypothetical protein IKO68_13745 [Oscillospiraceae bacterium]|nr:hypothetical protein [Oscillospiraceae bacterium]